MARGFIALLFLMTAAAEVHAAESALVCFESKAAGFDATPRGSWLPRSIKPDSRYTLRPMTDAEKSGSLGAGGKTWVFTSGLSPEVKVPCVLDERAHEIACDGVRRFRMNTVTNRFFTAYLHGFTGGDKDVNDTPYIGLGLCLPP
jgi:hypothetical protein